MSANASGLGATFRYFTGSAAVGLLSAALSGACSAPVPVAATEPDKFDLACAIRAADNSERIQRFSFDLSRRVFCLTEQCESGDRDLFPIESVSDGEITIFRNDRGRWYINRYSGDYYREVTNDLGDSAIDNGFCQTLPHTPIPQPQF